MRCATGRVARQGYSDGGHQGTGLMVRLSGLKEGTVYEVQVRAVNEEGMSEWSEPGEGRTDREEAGPGRSLGLQRGRAGGEASDPADKRARRGLPEALSCGSGRATGSSRSSRGGRRPPPGARALPDRAATAMRGQVPAWGRLSLAYDDGASCEIRLSFTESGVGGFAYDCGGGDPAEGRFRLTTGSLFVPVILSAAGQNQSLFTSELTLTNRGEREARLHYTYTAHIGGGSGRASDVLAPGRQKIETDALGYLRGLGIAIPETGNRIGTLRVEARLGSEVEAVVRTTTAVVEGGQGWPTWGSARRRAFKCRSICAGCGRTAGTAPTWPSRTWERPRREPSP